MTINNLEQRMLRELAEGKEINWDYMLNMVKEGRVTREDAITALRQGLSEVIIPEYRRMAKTGDSYYWGQRLTEAETALEAINKGQTVKYRGIEL